MSVESTEKYVRGTSRIFAAAASVFGVGLVANIATVGFLTLAEQKEPAGILEPARQWIHSLDLTEKNKKDLTLAWAMYMWPVTALSGAVAFATGLSLNDEKKHLAKLKSEQPQLNA